MEVTEKTIGKAGLSPDEAKVIRFVHGLKTAGKTTKRWIEHNLSEEQYFQLLESAGGKINLLKKG